MKMIQSLSYGFRITKDIVKASPGRILFEVIDVFAEVVNSILVRTVWVKFILDCVVAGEFQKAVLWILAAAVLDFSCMAYQSWMAAYYRKKDNIRLHRYFHKQLYRASVDVDVCYYDNPEYYDRFILAARNSDTVAVQFIDTFRNVMITIAEVILSGGLIISKLGYLLWIIIPVSITYALCSSYNAQERVEMTKAMAPFEKKGEYVKRVFFMKDYAIDLRATHVSELLLRMLRSSQKEAVEKIWPYEKRDVYYIQSMDCCFIFNILRLLLC